MHSIIVTLIEGDYDKGLGALLNSLVYSGFEGKVVIGHRGRTPQFGARELLSWAGISKVEVICKAIHVSCHLTNYKAQFALEVGEEYLRGLRSIFYIDPDVVVLKEWKFFEHWVELGMVCFNDVTRTAMHPNHPIKLEWKRRAKQLGHSTRSVPGYINGGFLGLSHQHFEFLRLWRDNMVAATDDGLLAPELLTRQDSANPFSSADQDVLNMSVLMSDVPVCMATKEDMGIGAQTGYVAHALGPRKPWRRGFLRDLIVRGARPSFAAKMYWEFVTEPIPVMTRRQRRMARLEIKAASALSRFIGS